MLKQCFDEIFVEKYTGFNIYIHNGAKFDYIFFIEYLLSRTDIKFNEVLYKDGKFLQLSILI